MTACSNFLDGWPGEAGDGLGRRGIGQMTAWDDYQGDWPGDYMGN